MKRLLLLSVTVLALAGSMFLAARDNQPSPLKIDRGETVNPWSSLSMNNTARNFQFAVVTDRTGGMRMQVFEKAVRKLNIMQPEFVISVGDLINGYTEDSGELQRQWDEFNGFIKDLKVPFFYVPGNHDVTNEKMKELWRQMFGRTYYHFVYHDVLFLAMNSDEAPRDAKDLAIKNLGAEQVEYFKKVIAENQGVRHTLLFMHKPLWSYEDGKGTGLPEIEAALSGRPYTVFCGHQHNYKTWLRNGNRYIQFATTGGGSMMRGKTHGEFDQIAWITMTDEGPQIANVLLDGIVDIDLEQDLKLDQEMVAAQEVQRQEQEKAKREAEKRKAEEAARKKAAQ